MDDKVYNIDFKKLAILWLPTFFRTLEIIVFSIVLTAPLMSLYIVLLKTRKENLIRMQITYQKFSMQKRLNDLFDKSERRIRIVKAVQYEGLYLYTEAEDDALKSKTKWLFGDEKPIYLRTESELYSEFDFIVRIPDTGINDLQLRAEIEYYMLQSKNYTIEIV
jgi:hypothetical protein